MTSNAKMEISRVLTLNVNINPIINSAAQNQIANPNL